MPPPDAPPRHTVVACAGGNRIRLETRPAAAPGPGEMVLKLRVAGLCGTDLFKLDSGRAAPGAVLGHELVGEVAAVGEGVFAFAPGDRVVVPHHVPCGRCHLCRQGSETQCAAFRDNLLEPGGFSQRVLVRERAVSHAARRLPPGLSDETAVFVEPAACVLRGIRRASFPPDGLAVVLGGGSMGLLHVLVLKAVAPAATVLLIDPLSGRRDLAVGLGAALALAPGPAARDGVERHAGAGGADAVFDTVGGAACLDTALDLSRPGGTVVLFAHAGDGETAGFVINALFQSERRLVGTYSGGPREQEDVFRLLVDGTLDPAPLVSHRLPLAHFERGVTLARARKALKILFTAGADTAAPGLP